MQVNTADILSMIFNDKRMFYAGSHKDFFGIVPFSRILLLDCRNVLELSHLMLNARNTGKLERSVSLSVCLRLLAL